MQTDHVVTTWKKNMLFHTTNPAGELYIETSPEHGGEGTGLRPKALMLSSLTGCSALDVASLMKKMKLDVADFNIDIKAELTDEHPRYYHKVYMVFNFYGSALNEAKLQKAVDLSIEKYCGVMAMFKKFADVEVETVFHHQ
ncbi:OsmC family protein [Robertkochia sediminum]|uniref:OsmC family protein n=1 Tax=Robertkochia sediminum TaxID=2785326 RepID=UPI001934878D|nr:OsmC family protein [Robertkochia sediminum]MBL7471322.1 OsmC family protein [Robertkochia sediminum]